MQVAQARVHLVLVVLQGTGWGGVALGKRWSGAAGRLFGTVAAQLCCAVLQKPAECALPSMQLLPLRSCLPHPALPHLQLCVSVAAVHNHHCLRAPLHPASRHQHLQCR